jgi:hypothetical protein
MHHKAGNGVGYRTDAAVRCITITGSGQGSRNFAGVVSLYLSETEVNRMLGVGGLFNMNCLLSE